MKKWRKKCPKNIPCFYTCLYYRLFALGKVLISKIREHKTPLLVSIIFPLFLTIIFFRQELHMNVDGFFSISLYFFLHRIYIEGLPEVGVCNFLYIFLLLHRVFNCLNYLFLIFFYWLQNDVHLTLLTIFYRHLIFLNSSLPYYTFIIQLKS